MNKRKIKLLCISPHFRSGGSERVMLNIINHLSKDKFDITLLLFNKDGVLLNKVSDNVQIINTSVNRTRGTIPELIKIFKSGKYDMIFAMKGYIALIIWIAKLMSKSSIPIVYREVTHVSTDIQNKNITLKFLLKTFLKYVYRGQKRIVSPSKAIKEDLVKKFKVNKNKIQIIPNPLEVKVVQNLSEEKVTDEWFFNDIPIITSMGRLTVEKDFKTLIKAVKEVNNEKPLRLIIIGEGPLEEELTVYTGQLEIGDMVKFIGVKSNPFKYISKSQIYVLSSLYEGFPNALVEAMACKTPVIATACTSGVSEIIENYQEGIIIPVGDYKEMSKEIMNILENKKLALTLATNGEKKVRENLDINEIIKHYEEIFMELSLKD